MVLIKFEPRLSYSKSFKQVIPILRSGENLLSGHYPLIAKLDGMFPIYLPEEEAIQELASLLYLISGEI